MSRTTAVSSVSGLAVPWCLNHRERGWCRADADGLRARYARRIMNPVISKRRRSNMGRTTGEAERKQTDQGPITEGVEGEPLQGSESRRRGHRSPYLQFLHVVGWCLTLYPTRHFRGTFGFFAAHGGVWCGDPGNCAAYHETRYCCIITNRREARKNLENGTQLPCRTSIGSLCSHSISNNYKRVHTCEEDCCIMDETMSPPAHLHLDMVL